MPASIYRLLRRFGLLPEFRPVLRYKFHILLQFLPQEKETPICATTYIPSQDNPYRFHILHQFLPQEKETPYVLQPISHHRIIPRADNKCFAISSVCSVNTKFSLFFLHHCFCQNFCVPIRWFF